MTRQEMHMEICKELNEIYKKKNHDYGNSFKKVRDEVPNAILVRVLDKANRLTQLMQNGGQQVNDESIEDTLKDLANYAIMEVIERRIDAPNAKSEFKVGDMVRLKVGSSYEKNFFGVREIDYINPNGWATVDGMTRNYYLKSLERIEE